jgi:hypothetical protein
MSETSFRTEFPDYDPATMPEIPGDWRDLSWHNDACPLFECARSPADVEDGGWSLHVNVDYAEPERREIQGPRFRVWIEHEGPANGHCLFITDDWDQVLLALPGLGETARIMTRGKKW